MALFITFEGDEGSGKTTQAEVLYRRLSELKIPGVLTHEPGGTQAGDEIARLLKWSQNTSISPLAELMLFNASRAQLVEEVIQPALREGKVVICDRFADSTTAYQSYGRGLDLKMVKAVNNAATQGLKPHLTVLLDISPEASLTRIQGREKDRFEQEDIDFHNKVRQGYLKLAAAEPERWLVVDASQSKDKIRKIIWQKVSQLLPG
ncbi:dTMP kinase [Chloroflexota bacterium]